jgi:molybdopterin converting factor small subunit
LKILISRSEGLYGGYSVKNCAPQLGVAVAAVVDNYIAKRTQNLLFDRGFVIYARRVQQTTTDQRASNDGDEWRIGCRLSKACCELVRWS